MGSRGTVKHAVVALATALSLVAPTLTGCGPSSTEIDPGEAVEANNVEFTVTSDSFVWAQTYTESPGSLFAIIASDGNTNIVTHLSVTNSSKESLDPSDLLDVSFELEDGSEYDASFYPLEDGNIGGEWDIPAGGTKEFLIYAETPSAAKESESDVSVRIEANGSEYRVNYDAEDAEDRDAVTSVGLNEQAVSDEFSVAASTSSRVDSFVAPNQPPNTRNTFGESEEGADYYLVTLNVSNGSGEEVDPDEVITGPEIVINGENRYSAETVTIDADGTFELLDGIPSGGARDVYVYSDPGIPDSVLDEANSITLEFELAGKKYEIALS